MISFIGAGNVGTALGVYFKEKGINVCGYYSRTLQSTRKSAELTSSKPYTNLYDLINESQTIWITTNDDAIKHVAFEISRLQFPGQKTFIHASGLLTSDVLILLKEKGHKVCSAHPLLAFNELNKAVKFLDKTNFFIEGDCNGPDSIIDILNRSNNPFLEIKKENKIAYHTAACVVSNYLVTLVHASDEIFKLAAISETKLAAATNTLIESVLVNLSTKTPKDALTGPIKRGDAETVKKHIEILENKLPELVCLYKSLGTETMRMIDDFRLKDVLT